MKHTFSILSNILWAAFFLTTFISNAYADEKYLKIGVSATYTGGFAAVGKHVSDGEIDYLNYINHQGGLAYKDPLTGKNEQIKLKIMVEDNRYNAAKAVSAYQKFKAQGANVIIGFGSTPGEACAAKASVDKLPYLSWYSYASPAGYRPEPQYYWSLLPSIAESATPMIKWFIHQKWKKKQKPKIGILAANLPSWQVLGKPGIMDDYIEKNGGQLVGIEFIPLIANDLSRPLTRLFYEKKADALILIGTLSQTVSLAKDLYRVGIDPQKTTVIYSLSAWDESLFKSIPAIVQGLYGEVHAISVNSDVPGMKKVKEVAKWAGKNPEKIVINYANGFMGALVLENALRRALETHGYEKVAGSGKIIRNELQKFKKIDSMGLTPSLEVKHLDYPYFLNYSRIVQAKNGKFEDAGEWIPIDRIKDVFK